MRFWYWRNSDLIFVFVRKRDIPRTVLLSGGCFILKSCMDPNHDDFVREIQIQEFVRQGDLPPWKMTN